MDTSLPILVVDDSQTVRLAVSRQLESLGYADVDCAEDGHSALGRLRQKKYGLVLSDWEMAPMGGEAFLKALRQEAKTPVVLMTGTTTRGTSWLAGADAYLPKPFNPGDLEAAIKVALRTK